MEFTYDLRRSLSENAQECYRKAKEAKSKLAGARKALEETERKIASQSLEEAAPDKVLVKRRERQWYEKYRWFRSSQGLLVLGGRDATTNEILIKKHTEPTDVVFHADVHGAPFFVVKTEGKELGDETIAEAAEAAASYSKAWKSHHGSCDTYYVNPDQLSKTPEAGEYLTKGAFVVRGQKNWIKNVELKLAVGVRRDKDLVEVVGGPVNAVKKHARQYITIGVGDMKQGELAKKIKEKLMKESSKEDREVIKTVKLDEIQRWIPAGGGQTVD